MSGGVASAIPGAAPGAAPGATPSAARLLGAWERGQGATPAARGLLLLALAVPGADAATLAAATIGLRDAWLLTLRERLFGSAAEGVTACAACGETIAAAFDTRDVRAPFAAPAPPHPSAPANAPAPPDATFEIVAAGRALACRLPDSGDLLAVEGSATIAAARGLLATRCTGADDLSPAELAAVEAAMAARDGQAEILLDLACPACATPALALFDIVRQLWSDLDGWARAMLRAVDVLAGRYHWSEAAILRLSPARRAHYLALAGAA